MIFDQAHSEHVNNGTISDGAVIAATGVRLINSDSGRIYGGVTFSVGGSTLTNLLGGVISLSQFDQTYPPPVIVTGSSGADTVINAGLIDGTVAFGGGADTYVERDGSVRGLDFGAGDDLYRVEGTEPKIVAIGGEGGDGYDRLVMGGTAGGYYVANATHYGPNLSVISGFEELVFEAGGIFIGFSGFQEISIKSMPVQNTSLNLVNLNDCLNPEANLTLTGSTVFLSRSSLRSITGSDQNDFVNLYVGNQVSGAISLAGGDDVLRHISHSGSEAPTSTGIVDGGDGSDTLMLDWSYAADRSFDFSAYHNFEKLMVNSLNQEGLSTATVKGLEGLTDIDIGGRVMLILSDSVSPDARAWGGSGGGLTLEVGSVIGRFVSSDSWNNSVDLAQGDPARSTTIINRGTINGEVRFYTGDDVYDGRTGSVGGTVYGNAGNDTLRGGAGAETLVGGFGADLLEGNGGNDRLDGGAGNDRLVGGDGSDVLLGGLGADVMTGGAGSDIYEVDSINDVVFEHAGQGIADNVFAYVDFALSANTDNLLMNYGVQTYGYGNGGDNIIVGNSRANVIEGKAGYDTMTGGAGSDLFIINPGFGVDVITDFTAGAGSQDALIFSRALFTSFAQVMAHSAQVGADTWIGDGLGNTIVLVGVQAGTLHANDFGFI